MAVLMALTCGLARHSAATSGSFWVDLMRGVLYILLPLALLLALTLVTQGMVQTLSPSLAVTLIDITTLTCATLRTLNTLLLEDRSKSGYNGFDLLWISSIDRRRPCQ
jgi:K+-transporting ATPase A subunit